MTKQKIEIIDIDQRTLITSIEVDFPIIAGEILFIQSKEKNQSIKIYQVMQVQKYFLIQNSENHQKVIVRNLSSQIITGNSVKVIS